MPTGDGDVPRLLDWATREDSSNRNIQVEYVVSPKQGVPEEEGNIAGPFGTENSKALQVDSSFQEENAGRVGDR